MHHPNNCDKNHLCNDTLVQLIIVHLGYYYSKIKIKTKELIEETLKKRRYNSSTTTYVNKDRIELKLYEELLKKQFYLFFSFTLLKTENTKTWSLRIYLNDAKFLVPKKIFSVRKLMG